jgi:hypothetical protein
LFRERLLKDLNEKVALRGINAQNDNMPKVHNKALPLDMDFDSLSKGKEIVSEMFKKVLRRLAKNPVDLKPPNTLHRYFN